MRMKSPTVTITTAITDCCTGRMKTSCVTTPRTKAISSVRKNASQKVTPHTVNW